MKKKPFDCVEMKRQAAAKIYERIKTMTIEEELRFWNTPIEEDATDYATAVHIKHTNKKWGTPTDLKQKVGL